MGLAEALRRFGTMPPGRPHGARRRARRARGWRWCRCRRSSTQMLAPIVTSTPECAAMYAPGRAAAAGGRHVPAAGAGRPAGPAGRRGAGLPLHGRRGGRGERLGARAGRPADAARTWPRTRWSSASPARVELPRPRGAHQPAAVVGRHPDRGRARNARAARSARATRARGREVIDATNRARDDEFLDGLAPRATSSGSWPRRRSTRWPPRCARGSATPRTSR